MTKIFVCGVDQLAATVADANPDLVISITDPDTASIAVANTALAGCSSKVIALGFHDVEHRSDHNRAFSRDMARGLLADLDTHFQGDGTILVHCAMGVSRSTASAILALAHLASRVSPPSDALARQIVDQVYAAAPDANPNMRVIEIADGLLDFDGALVQAVHDRRSAKIVAAMRQD